MKLTAVGFLQYLAPTCQLLLAIFHHHEQVTRAQWLGFVPIWLGLVIFSIDSVMPRRDPPMTSADESPELLTLER
jgi:chloramphenicol-sensitive protein RarD